MSQSKKKRTDNRSVEEPSSSQAIDKAPEGRWTRLIIASVVIAVLLIIVGVFYYFSPDQRYLRITVLTVDDTSIRMDHFLKRSELAGADPLSMLEVLTKEQVIKLEAPRYGIEVSPEDIDQALREIARGESESISESEFREWYRQQLNESGLSDAEYKESTHTNLLAARLHEYLAERVPTVAEQLHLHTILLETYEDAEEVRARLEAGEGFADLAREVSLDRESGEKGGDLGWFPRGALDPQWEYEAFNLSTGNVSQPLEYYDVSDPSSLETVYSYLLMVSEKADAREVDEDSLQALKDNALEDWLLEEIGFHEIKYHGFNNGFDSETYAWMNWQLSKSAR